MLRRPGGALSAASVLILLTFSAAAAAPQDVRERTIEPQRHLEWATGKRRAVVVGVSHYQNLEPRYQLEFAHRDAQEFARFIRSGAMGPLDSVVVLLNEQATVRQVNAHIRAALEDSNRDDVVIIFFAGHGDVDTDDDNSTDGFLLTHDAENRHNYPFSALSLNMLGTHIGRAAGRGVRVILITDACRSGKAGELGGARATASVLNTEAQHVLKLVSSQVHELSYEDPALQHGLFTYYLLRGLTGFRSDGTGAADENGVVSADDLADWVRERVRQRRRDQSPRHYGRAVPVALVSPDSAARFRLQQDGSASILPLRLPGHEWLVRSTEAYPRELVRLAAAADGGWPFTLSGTTFAERPVGNPATADRVALTETGRVPPRDDVDVFRQALAARRLVDHGDSSAWSIYHRLLAAGTAATVTNGLRRELTVALEEDADELIRIYLRGGNDQPSSEAYRTAARLLRHALELIPADDPYHPNVEARALFLEGYTIVRREERPLYHEAIGKLLRSIELQPEAAYPYNAVAEAYLHLNRFTDAESAAQEASRRAPRWTYPLHVLGRLRERQSRYPEAIEFYMSILQIDSTAYYAYNTLGNTYWSLDRYQEAERLYRRSIAADPRRGVAHANLAQLYRSKKRYLEAKAEADSALQLDATHPERPFWIWPRLVRGWLYEDLRPLEGTTNDSLASDAFTRAAEQAPFNAEPYHELGRLYHQRRRYGEAEAMFRRAIANDSSYAAAYAGLAYVLHARDNLYALTGESQPRFAEVERLLIDAVERAAHPSRPLIALGDYWTWIAEFRGNPEEDRYYSRADSAYRRAIGYDPLRLTAYYKLARLLEKRGDRPAAETWYRQAENAGSRSLTAGVDARSPEPANQLGEFFYRASHGLDVKLREAMLDSAAAAFLRAVAIDSTYPPARNNLGVLYLERGAYAAAAQQLLVAARLGFTDVDVVDYADLLRSGAAAVANTQPDSALFIYGAAVALDPLNHRAFDDQARLLYRLGRAAEAAPASDSSLALAPGEPTWLQLYVPTRILIALDLNDLAGAEALLGRIPPGAAGTRLALIRAMIEIERRRPGEARALFDAVRATEPRVADAAYLRNELQLSERAIARLQRIHLGQPGES